MKKITVASLALSASSAFAFPGPINHGVSYVKKTYCLSVYELEDGAKIAGGCDESDNNVEKELPLNSAGCAEGQVALSTRKRSSERKFPIEIHACMPVNVAQL